MTLFDLTWRSLQHYRRIHFAVGAGVAVATAVLTGALLVGDSVRGSLRDLTLERLGRIDEVLVAPHFFRAALAGELAANAEFQQHFASAEPAILVPGTLEAGTGNSARRATQVSVVGTSENFWSLGNGGPAKALAEGEIAITEPLARELDAKVGETILVRIPIAGAVPADSPLGEKDDTSRNRRLRVAEILEPQGLARFALRPSQQLPRNAFVPLATLQSLLDKPGRANLVLLAGADEDATTTTAAELAIADALQPTVDDYGLRVEPIASPVETIEISADQLVLPDDVVAAAERAFPGGQLQPVVTYLANTLVIGKGDAERKIPYSTITGVDSVAGIGPLVDAVGKPIRLADDEIALNRWAADDLGAQVGDMVTVTYYEPESTHGLLREHRPPLELRLAQIVELEAEGRPTPAADPRLTPELPGVTDQESISDWQLPFELVEEIRPQDEEYWDEYRTTPKAFVSLATAKRLWESRWGTVSLLRVNQPAATAEDVGKRLLEQLQPADAGLVFLPVKRLGLEASGGTTPFDALFLGFSCFLIAAAVMLIALLFKLGVELRVTELGLLGAVGLPARRIARLLTREGLIVAAAGATVGVGAGIAYAWLMIFGLRTWWVAAVGTPFLALHATRWSLLVGWLAGFIVSWLTIRLATRQLARLPVGRLLAGNTEPAQARSATGESVGGWSRVREALVALAVALGIVGYLLRDEARAGVFFGSGAVVLALLLGEVRYRLRKAGRGGVSWGKLNLPTLAALNTARHPRRSTLTIGLVATATFLIAAISAFRLETGDEGTGGFALVATSDRPIHFDLNTPDGRIELGFSDRDSRLLDSWQTYSLRVADGEDASCLNLYRPTQPRVLGLPVQFVERGEFGWVDSSVQSGAGNANPWSLLSSDLGQDDAGRPIVPVVLDANTAIYSLHLRGVGSRLAIRDAAGDAVTLEVVGMLKNSVLQGNLLVSEANFLRLFPDTGGYRYFLFAPNTQEGTADADVVAQILESTLAVDGFDAVAARDQLAQFLAVQNTYLSTFQSLGALGLLLGTVGLAVVQLRNVLERRRELALMRAAGFRSRRLVQLVILENGVLLLGGLLVGLVAAAIALAPQWAPQGATIPWLTLTALLGTIAVVGLMAGWLATRSVLRAPLLPALRGE
jgi:ABC-type antimicrobial peptide transport system permease subunit